MFGIWAVFPGKAVPVSTIPPMLLTWWLRPLFRAVRVGEQTAVVWKLLKRSPPPASRSKVGVPTGPPNALVPAKPRSSTRTSSTLGAPFGAFTSKRGGGVALRASSSV